MISDCNSLHAGTYYYDVAAPDDPYISKDGSVQQRINAYEASHGDRFIRIWGDAPITNASFCSITHDVANSGDQGDSYSQYILTVTTASTKLIWEFAGHLSIGGSNNSGLNWGPNLGSGFINGGPYHFNLDGLGGGAACSNPYTGSLDPEFVSLGSQDNQIKGADILAGPSCNVTPSSQTICNGSSATFTAVPVGTVHSPMYGTRSYNTVDYCNSILKHYDHLYSNDNGCNNQVTTCTAR
jgi:hypothetical protein